MRVSQSLCFNKDVSSDGSAPHFWKRICMSRRLCQSIWFKRSLIPSGTVREQVFIFTSCFSWVRVVCQSACFKRSLSSRGGAPHFSSHCSMWEHVFRIHHRPFMIEKSVSQYIFWALVQFRRSRTHLFINVKVQCESTFVMCTICFLWLRKVCPSIFFNRCFSSSAQTVPHGIFLKRDLTMRGHICHTHDLSVVSEESVSENVFHKVAADGLTTNFQERDRTMR